MKRVLDFLSGRTSIEPTKGADEFQLAVAALLVEAAQMDESFDASERATIAHLLEGRFGLDAKAVSTLMAEAEKAVGKSSQTFSFTHQINRTLPPEKRGEIIEMLWQVAYTDGILDPLEDMLLRRVAGLIHVTDRERGLARQRALEKIAGRKGVSGA
jgi:uncharacterized tellurite resistance protein B-like protein